jgi:hypothetical protein
MQSSNDGTDLATLNLRGNKTETAQGDAVQNDSAAIVNANTIAWQIIIVFPTYFNLD